MGNEGIPTCRSLFQRASCFEYHEFPYIGQFDLLDILFQLLFLFNYSQLLCSVDPKLLKLTPFDDQIYQTFREDFPDFNINLVREDDIKTPEAKAKWREFINKFNKLEDFSYGTLMRSDASLEFGPDNSVLVVRVQFLAIEIARNREGVNDEVRTKFKPTPPTKTPENVS